MVKARFSAADVRAMVRDLRGRVLGMRCVNVYDIDAKTYLLKLAEPGVAEKVVLLLESGVRFHSTRFDRDKADMPSKTDDSDVADAPSMLFAMAVSVVYDRAVPGTLPRPACAAGAGAWCAAPWRPGVRNRGRTRCAPHTAPSLLCSLPHATPGTSC